MSNDSDRSRNSASCCCYYCSNDSDRSLGSQESQPHAATTAVMNHSLASSQMTPYSLRALVKSSALLREQGVIWDTADGLVRGITMVVRYTDIHTFLPCLCHHRIYGITGGAHKGRFFFTKLFIAAGAVLSSLDEKVPIVNGQLLSLSC